MKMFLRNSILLLCFFPVFLYIFSSASDNEYADLGGLDDLSSFSDEKMMDVLGMDVNGVKERLEKLFHIIDKNANGTLEEDELQAWAEFVKNEVFLKQVQVEMTQIDSDGDGFISLSELNEAFAQNLDEKEVEKHSAGLLKRFKIVDKDGDNKLNIQEVALLVNPLKDENLKELEVTEILEHHDLNNDGKISLEEFKQTRSEDASKKDDAALIQEDFNFFDVNKDGFIDKDEIVRIYFDPTHETGTVNLKEIKTSIFEDKEITLDLWKEKSLRIAVTSLTDFGDILRYPEDFKLDIGKNVVLPSTKVGTDDEELDSDESDNQNRSEESVGETVETTDEL